MKQAELGSGSNAVAHCPEGHDLNQYSRDSRRMKDQLLTCTLCVCTPILRKTTSTLWMLLVILVVR